MSIESRIARRYLWAARKQAHTAFLSLISMLGLALGVATLLVSIALLSGLQSQIKGRLIEASPQLLVEPAGANTIGDASAIVAEGKKYGMTDIRPYVSGIGWGANEDAQRQRPLRIRSYPPGREPRADRGARSSISAEPGEPRIFLTRGAAASLSLDIGEVITVVAPRARLTPFGPVPVWKKYRITRLTEPAGETDTTDAWLADDEMGALFGTGGDPTAIEMFGPADAADGAQAALAQKFSGAQFKTWKEINRPLFLALRLEKIVMFATISLIIFVAALNLVSSLAMLIMEKRPSVGVLRTLGATNGNILGIFLRTGLLIGLTGTLLGNIFGLGFSWAANKWHLVPLPAQIYFIDYLPFELDVVDVVGVNAIAIFLSVIATWYPAHVAARLDPITAIKDSD